MNEQEKMLEALGLEDIDPLTAEGALALRRALYRSGISIWISWLQNCSVAPAQIKIALDLESAYYDSVAKDGEPDEEAQLLLDAALEAYRCKWFGRDEK
jgi:hypothetical protein